MNVKWWRHASDNHPSLVTASYRKISFFLPKIMSALLPSIQTVDGDFIASVLKMYNSTRNERRLIWCFVTSIFLPFSVLHSESGSNGSLNYFRQSNKLKFCLLHYSLSWKQFTRFCAVVLQLEASTGKPNIFFEVDLSCCFRYAHKLHGRCSMPREVHHSKLFVAVKCGSLRNIEAMLSRNKLNVRYV